MSYSNGGRARPMRSQGPRRSFNNYRSNATHINPAKYINTAVEPKLQKTVVIQNSFADFNLHPQLLANIGLLQYSEPTPVQDQSIPPMMEGRDLVGIANTGTGKTAAFLIPLIHKIANDLNQGALIVVPTRELATQIADEFHKLANKMPIGMVTCVGGMSLDPQIRALRNNPHVVVGTPGRLKDLIKRRALDTSMFSNIVLDEVDRMLDIGFVQDIRYLISLLPEERSSYFFSATLNREAEEIMKTFLKDPVRVSVRTRETSEHIHQDVVRVDYGKNKIEVLYDLLTQKEFEKVIVFGRTKHGINKLEEILRARGLKVSAIHGNKTQNARQRSLNEFKKGNVQALLATDVAARGIDISGVSHVINYDEPATYEDYIHRIGRTGRAGKTGIALTFVS